MIKYIRKLIFTNYYAQIVASNLYILFSFLQNKKKINIFYENNYWIHETFLGKFAYTHPVRKTEECLMGELPFFLKNYKCKPGDIIFDAGAGVGTESIFFSKMVGPKGKVFALEANPEVFKILLKTLELNKISNVIPINLAVFKQSGKNIKFSNDMENWLGGKIDKFNGNSIVKTITFDDLLIKYNIEKIDFAKFNIEGAEKYLISGEKKFINLCENVCISCHDFTKDKKAHTFKVISKLLEKNNFNFLTDNKNIKKIKEDKLYYVYATRKKNMTQKYDKNDLNNYEFFKKIFD